MFKQLIEELAFFQSSVDVDLRGNPIKHLTVLEHLKDHRDKYKGIIIMGDNPFDCTCDALPVIRYEINHNYPLLRFSIRDLKCATPAKLNEKAIADIDMKELDCDPIVN